MFSSYHISPVHIRQIFIITLLSLVSGVGNCAVVTGDHLILFLGGTLALFMKTSLLMSGVDFADDCLMLLLEDRLAFFMNISLLLIDVDLADSCIAFLPVERLFFMSTCLPKAGVDFMVDRSILVLGERLGFFPNIFLLLIGGDLADSCFAFLPVERLFFASIPLLMSGVCWEALDFSNPWSELCEG